MPETRRLPVRATILTAIALTVVAGMALGAWATLSEQRIDTEGWRTLIVGGVARGSAYGVIAVGYTLVYGVLFMINFAHGEVFMAGAFSTLFVARTLSRVGLLNTEPILSIGILFASSMTISMLVSVILERVAYRPLRDAPRLILLITSIGASLFLQGSFFGFFGPSSVAYPEIEILQGHTGGLVTVKQLVVVVGTMVLMVGLQLFIQRTRTGRSMRAVGEDREIAALMGIDVDRVIVKTFAISGVLAGAAGILFVFLFNQVRFFMGTLPGIKAFTAAILGGIGNVLGAGLGGILLGVLENVGPVLFLSGTTVPAPNQLQPVITFGILVLVLIFRPGGILMPADQSKS